MNILVTGCAGFIGSHLCEFLLKAGHTVAGLDNMNGFYDQDIKKTNLTSIQHGAEKLGKEFFFYEGDIRHQETVAQVLQQSKIDTIVHLAAMAGVRPSFVNPTLYTDVNIKGTLTLLEGSRQAGIKKFIFGSSSSVYGNASQVPFKEMDPAINPISPYAATKRAGELLCQVYARAYDMRIAALRFFTVYGPRQRPDLAIAKFSRLLQEGRKIPIFGDGTKRRDFTYIDDIISGIDGAIKWLHEAREACCEIFNLGESHVTSVNELVNLIEAAFDKKADRQYLPDEPGDVNVTCADITKAKKILGYAPKTQIATGVAKYVAWLKQSR